MNSALIELSAVHSRQKISSGEWTNNLQHPFTLNPGDQITVRQSIIDANLAGDSFDNITIAQDIPLLLEFGFYYVNDSDDLTYGLTIDTAQKLGFYVARDTTTKELIKNQISFTIPAGNYSASGLAEYISAFISKMPEYETIDQFSSIGAGIIEPMFNSYEIGCESFVDDKNFGFNSVVSTNALTPQQIAAYPAGTEIYCFWRDNDSSIQKTENSILNIDVQTNTINFTDVISYLETDNRITDVYIVLKTAVATTFYNQYGTPADTIKPKSIFRFMGANQFALEYNINNSNRFQFSVFHMSPYPTNTDSDTSVNVIQYNNSGSLYFLDTRSGLFFTQLQPVSFWQDLLGFNLTNLLVVDSAPALCKLQTPLKRGVNITSNYVGADCLIASTRTLGSLPVSPYSYKTTLTNSILAEKAFISQDTGYFLLEIQAIPTDYNSELAGLSSGIIQIISNAYDSGGLITSYNDSALSFQNNTTSVITYGSFKVRILNPKDYTVLTTLGPRSTVFLEIIRGARQQ